MVTRAQLFNPFRAQKYEELGREPIIYVSPLIKRLDQRRSVYVVGSRGSGKTTILKALETKERVANKYLQNQIDKDDFITNLNIYFHALDLFDIPILHRLRIDSWTDAISKLRAHKIIMFYIEIWSCLKIIETIEDLKIGMHLQYSVRDEDAFVASVKSFDTFFDDQLRTNAYLSGLPAVKRGFENLLNQIRRVSSRADYLAYFEKVPVEIPDGIVAPFFRLVQKNLHKRAKVLRIMVDDVQAADSILHPCLNHRVRFSRSSIFWLLAYAGEVPTHKTLSETEVMTDADRRIFNIDEENTNNEARFIEVCDKISTMRIRKMFEDSNEKLEDEWRFSCRRFLGNFTINELLDFAGSQSRSPRWQHFRARAATLKAKLVQAQAEGRETTERRRTRPYLDSIPAYYEQLLWESGWLRTTRPRRSASFKSEPPAITVPAALRRKERAALVLLCKEYKFHFPFGGESVVRSMCDGSVRDYLNLMADICDELVGRNEDATRYILTGEQVPLAYQVRAIASSSAAKVSGVSSLGAGLTEELSRLVLACGMITHQLQTNDVRLALRFPERGVFVLTMTPPTVSDNQSPSAHLNAFEDLGISQTSRSALQLVRSVINEGFTSGYLRRAKVSDRFLSRRRADGAIPIFSFRLHRRVSAEFKYSYRGAYEPVQFDVNDVLRIIACEERSKLVVIANQMSGRMDGEAARAQQGILPI